MRGTSDHAECFSPCSEMYCLERSVFKSRVSSCFIAWGLVLMEGPACQAISTTFLIKNKPRLKSTTFLIKNKPRLKSTTFFSRKLSKAKIKCHSRKIREQFADNYNLSLTSDFFLYNKNDGRFNRSFRRLNRVLNIFFLN